MGPKPRSLEERLWEKVDRRGPDECWNWLGAISTHGYGEIRINQPRTMVLAHRLVYELCIGPIPENMLVCHRCDHKICCNPNHLFLGTSQDNIDDMWQKGRGKVHHQSINFGSTHGAAKLTEEKVLEIRRLSGQYPTSLLGLMFGVSQSNISAVINRKTWKHVA
jgi:hypothetical protein